ncbi:MAG: hypothetical protein LBT62_04075 [Deltaproteobacteria bacterium]|jgi:hypothetical protein|nr:hypothetical protein [Deltaproteobacteria bacterium]
MLFKFMLSSLFGNSGGSPKSGEDAIIENNIHTEHPLYNSAILARKSLHCLIPGLSLLNVETPARADSRFRVYTFLLAVGNYSFNQIRTLKAFVGL